MADVDGRIGFVNVLENDELQHGAEEAKRIFQGIGDKVEVESARIDSLYNKIGKGTAGLFAGAGVSAIVKDIVRVRSEFQNTEASFKVFLGDAEKAAEFMKDLQNYAFNNVFEFSDLTQQAANLLAFRTEAEDVIDVIDRLSNIAAGANKPLSELVALYNKAKSNDKLQAMDIQSWAGKGVNIAYELSKAMNTTEASINQMVSKGKIGFKELQLVIENMTNEGGQFAGMMEEKMKTLGDSVGLLQDSWTAMLNEIGEKNQDTLRSGILLANTFVENYEQIGRILLSIAATYGTYRAAVVALTVAQRVHTQMQIQAALAGKTLTTVQALQAVMVSRLSKVWLVLNKTMLANPYVAVATAVVGIAAAFWALRDSATAAEKAQKSYNEQQEEFLAQQDQNRQRTEELIRIIQDVNETEYGRIKAYQELSDLSPALAQAYDLEKLKTLELAEAQKTLNKERDEANYQNIIDNITKTKASIKSLKDEWDTFAKNPNETGINLIRVGKKIDAAEELLALHEKELRAHQERLKEMRPVEVKLAEAKADLEQIEDEFQKAKKKLEEEEDKLKDQSWGMIDIMVRLNFERLKGQKEEKEQIVSSLEQQTVVVEPTQNKEYWKKRKEDAESALALMDVSLKGTKAWNEQMKIIEEADRKMKAYTPSTKTAEQILDAQKKLKQRLVDGDMALIQSRIDIMKEGKVKELAQADLNHKQTLAKIDKEQEELAKAYKDAGKGSLTEADLQGFEERRKNASTERDDSKTKTEKKFAEELKEVYRQVGDIFLTEEQRKQAGIKKTHDEYRKWAKEAMEGGTLSEDEYKEFIIKVDNAELETSLHDSLEQFRTFEQRREDLAREYEEKIAQIEANNTDGKYDKVLEEARRQKDQALADLDATMADSTSLWGQLFDQYTQYTNKELEAIITNAREVLDYVNSTPPANIEGKFGLTAEQLRNLKANAAELGAAYDALYQKTQKFNQKNPFSAILKHSQSLKKTTTDIKKATEDLNKAQASGDKEAIKTAQDKLKVLKKQESLFKSDLKNAAESAIDYLGDIGSGFQEIGAASGDAGIESFGQALSDVAGIAQSFMEGGPIAAGITAVTTGLTAFFSSRAKYKAALKQMQQDLDAFAHEYKLLMSDLRLEGKDQINIFSEDAFERAMVALKEIKTFYDDYVTQVNKKDTLQFGNSFFGQIMAAQKAAKGITTDLQNIKIVTRHKTFFRSEKSKTLKELYPELFQGPDGFNVEAARALLNTNNQLNDEAKRQLQEVIDLYDQWQAAEEAFKEYLSETFGEIGNSLGDSIITAFEDGTDAMENWAQSFNNVLKNLAKQLMQTLFFQKHFDRLEKDLTSIYENYGDDPNMVASKVQQLFGTFFSGMSSTVAQAEKWYSDFVESAKQWGFDLAEATEETREAVAKGIATASQESINETNGRLTAIQSHTFHMNENLQIVANLMPIAIEHLSVIRSNTGETRNEIKDGNEVLQEQIKALSGDINNQLGQVKSGIQDINLKGVKIKMQ